LNRNHALAEGFDHVISVIGAGDAGIPILHHLLVVDEMARGILAMDLCPDSDPVMRFHGGGIRLLPTLKTDDAILAPRAPETHDGLGAVNLRTTSWVEFSAKADPGPGAIGA